MVLSLASLIPAPQAERKDASAAEAAPRRAERGEGNDRPEFGAMLEPAKPLPPRASTRAVDVHEHRVAGENPRRSADRADSMRDKPQDTKPERPDPLRDRPQADAKEKAPERARPLEDRPEKPVKATAGDAADAPKHEANPSGPAPTGDQTNADTIKPTASDEAPSDAAPVLTTAETTAETPSNSVTVQSATDLFAAVLATQAQHAETAPAQQDGQAPSAAATQGATVDLAGFQIAGAAAMTSGAAPVAGAITANTAQNSAASTVAGVVGDGSAAPAAPASALAAAGNGSAAELTSAAIEGEGASTSTAETSGGTGEGSVALPAGAPATRPQSGAKTPVQTPDLASLIGSQANATTGEVKADAKATTTAASQTVTSAKAKAADLLQPNVKSVPDSGPKPAFAEWMQDFAAAHNATHRSGDLVSSLDRLANGAPAQGAGQDVLRPTPLQMLPVEIGMQAMRGVTRFQIRLDPAELGRVEVKLEIKKTGEVEASLVVDRVETLSLLKRDANTLHQAFEQAGLKQSPDGLTFSLRGDGQKGEGQQGRDEQRPRWQNETKDEALPVQNQIAEIAMRRMMIPNSSLDRVI